jgi:hypothetical protein
MDSSMSALVALVDPIRTSVSLIEELRRRSVELLVVESGACGSLNGEGVLRAASVEAMADLLRALDVTHVLGCVDPSLLYADQLNALLGLRSNGLRRAHARRDKYAMNEAIRAAGLSAPWHFRAGDLSSLEKGLRAVEWPVVVKPAASGGSDNVHLCADLDQARAAFAHIVNARNLMGGVNEDALVQEYVDGLEYVVDCVSYDSMHVPIDLVRYEKGMHNGRAFIYEKEQFLRADDPVCTALVAFAQRALDALDVRYGASHMELKIDSHGAVRFIEMGARLNGGDVSTMVSDLRADRKGQVQHWIDMVLGSAAPAPAFELDRSGVRVYINAHSEGVLREWRFLDQIRALPSFARMSLNYQPGDTVRFTTDLSNDAGWIDLVHADEDVLRADECTLDAIIAGQPLVLA